MADARLGLACQCARVLLSGAASTIRIAHNAALTVSARSAAGDRSCGLANTGMCAKVWTWLAERLLAVPCSLVHAPSLVHVCLFREQNTFCPCAELETKVDQLQCCLQLQMSMMTVNVVRSTAAFWAVQLLLVLGHKGNAEMHSQMS